MVYSDYIKVLPVLRTRFFPFVVDAARDFMGDFVNGCSLRAFGSSGIENGGLSNIWMCLKFDYLDNCPSLAVDSFKQSFYKYLRFRLLEAGDEDGLNLLDLFFSVFEDYRVSCMSNGMFRVKFVVRSDFSMSRFDDIYGRVVA